MILRHLSLRHDSFISGIARLLLVLMKYMHKIAQKNSFSIATNFSRVLSVMTFDNRVGGTAPAVVLDDDGKRKVSGSGDGANETVGSIESTLTSVETELLPQLRNFRLESEEKLLAEFEEISREGAKLRADLEKRQEKVRALFAEYTKLKPVYIEHCKKAQMNQAPAWTKNLRPSKAENREKAGAWSQPERKSAFSPSWNVKHVDFSEPEAHDAEDTFRPKWKTSAAVARNQNDFKYTAKWKDGGGRTDENHEMGYSRWSNKSTSKSSEWTESGREYWTQHSQSKDESDYAYTRWNNQPNSSQSDQSTNRWNKSYEKSNWNKDKQESARVIHWEHEEPAPNYEHAKSWNRWKKAELEEPIIPYESRDSTWNRSVHKTSDNTWNREYYRVESPSPGLEDSIPRHLLDRFQSGRTIPKPPSSYPVSSNFIRGSLSGDAAMLS